MSETDKMQIKNLGGGTHLCDHCFCLLGAHGDIVNLVLLTEVTHHLIRGIKHLTQACEEPKASKEMLMSRKGERGPKNRHN